MSIHHYRPQFTVAEAQEKVQALYGLTATAIPLPSYEDQNFRIIDKSGDQFVLKIANASLSADLLDLENQAMAHLSVNGSALCPQVLPTRTGAMMTAVTDSTGVQFLARLITWLPGKMLVNVQPHSPALLHQIGRFLGDIDNKLADFAHPAAHRLWEWDIRHAAAAIRRFIVAIDNPERRALVERFLTGFETAVLPHLPHLPTGIIHGDANDYNLLITETDQIGIVDFGDVVHTITVAEPSIAAAYAMLDKDDPIAVAAHIIGGFHAVHPLTALEIELLPQLVPIRICISVVMSAYNKKLEPDNAYLAVTEEPGWELLAKLAATPLPDMHNAFRHACQQPPNLSKAEILAIRQKHLGPSLSVSYREPLKIVRGAGQFLYDETERPYLDCVNNVCHVGHSHPRVVAAAARQMAVLNTNTRTLHDNIIRYAQRLTATLPDPLTVCFFVNSGSEANDLALRLARAHTGRRDSIVLDGAYHGNLSSLIAISPYKFDGPGGMGAAAGVHTAVMPDPYRGPYKGAQSGPKYAAYIQQIIENKAARPAAFIAESLLGCGGQIVLPAGYLAAAYQHVRAAGGVCIADEVQVGFGRVGTHFWGFQTQNVVPDIVTMGKPMGNGHPLAAVVTTAAIAQSFHNGMEYFNTFGGNPVSCAIGLAVLDVIADDGLQQNALQVGAYLQDQLRGLMDKYPLIGDVRGAGLFIGIELVRDRNTLEPAAAEATAVVEQMKERGILLSTDGPLHNVIKIKPPILFTEENADLLTMTLDKVLSDKPHRFSSTSR